MKLKRRATILSLVAVMVLSLATFFALSGMPKYNAWANTDTTTNAESSVNNTEGTGSESATNSEDTTTTTVTPWDGTADTNWYNDTDTEFTLTTAEQLAGFAFLVNGGDTGTAADGKTFADKTIKLGADIDLNGRKEGATEWFTTDENGTVTVNSNQLWTPIGKPQNNYPTFAFNGTFDGGNHTIRNMCLVSDGQYVGFIGAFSGGSSTYTIKNIVFADCFVMSTYSGDDRMGVVFGQTNGNSTIENVTVKNSVVRGDKYIGAFAGALDSLTYCKLTNCSVINNTVYANASDTATYVGGFFGYCASGTTLTRCKVIGSVLVTPTTCTKYGLWGGLYGYGSNKVILNDCLSDSAEAVTSDDCVSYLTNNNYLVGLSDLTVDGKSIVAKYVTSEAGVIQYVVEGNNPIIVVSFLNKAEVPSFTVNGNDAKNYALNDDNTTLTISALENKANDIVFTATVGESTLNFRIVTGLTEMPTDIVATVDGKSLTQADSFIAEKDGCLYFKDVEGEGNILTVGFETALDANAKAVFKYNGTEVAVTGTEKANLGKLTGTNECVVEYYYMGILVSTTTYAKIVCLKSLGIDGLYYAEVGDYPWVKVSADDKVKYDYYKSTNQAVNSSQSIFNIYVFGQDALAYEWVQSSEKSYDYLKVDLNGAEKTNYKGKGATDTIDLTTTSWYTEKIEFTDPTSNVVTFTYRKDGSSSSGLDTAFIRNFAVKSFENKSKLDTCKIDSTINGVSEEETVENGAVVKYDYNATNIVRIYAPYLGEGETCNLYIDGVLSTATLFKDEQEGYYCYQIDGLKQTTLVEFEYSKAGYITERFGITLEVDLKGEIADYLVKYGKVDVSVDAYNDIANNLYPFKFNAKLSQEKGTYIFASTNQSVGSSSSGIAFTVYETGTLTFDYYISTESNCDIVYSNWRKRIVSSGYGENDIPPITYLNRTEFPYICGDITDDYKQGSSALSSGDLGWKTLTLPIEIPDGETSITIHFAFVKDGSVDRYDDIFEIANVGYATGDSTVRYSASETALNNCITAKCGETEIKNGGKVSIGSQITLEYVSGGTGSKFYGWFNVLTDKIESFDAKYTFYTTSETTAYKAIVTSASSAKYVARDSKRFYKSLAEAIAYTEDSKIVVINDCVIENNLEIPANVTLVLAYSSTDETGYKQNNTSTSRASWNNNIKPYLTLTVNSGATLTVNGKLIVGGVQHGTDQQATGRTSGDYAQLVNNGSIVINGYMDVIGLVTGEGSITVNNGATLRQPFMVNNYSGGTNTDALYYADQFPFTQFATVNVQCKQIINYGATVLGSTSLYFWSSIHTQDVILIDSIANKSTGTSAQGALIWMQEGSRLEITYDDNKKVNEQVGNIHLGDSGLSTIDVYGAITAGEFYLQGYGSGKMVLAIPYTYNFNFKSGSTVTVDQKYKIMPGAVVTIEEGATVNIGANGAIYVYDGLIQADKSGKVYPSNKVLAEYKFSQSGMLIVNGTLNIDGAFAGILQTTGKTAMVNVDTDATVGTQEITEGCSGGYVDNTAKFSMSGRIYGLYNFVQLETGKTYKGFSNDAFTLESFTATEASRIDSEKLSVILNQAMKGRFLEWNGTNYVATVNFTVNGANGVNVNVGGSENATIVDGKFSAQAVISKDGVITYYTEGYQKVKYTANVVINGETALDKVIKSVELDLEKDGTQTMRIYDKDGKIIQDFALFALVTYYGDAEGLYVKLTIVDAPTTAYVTENVVVQNDDYSFTGKTTLYVHTQSLAQYIADVEAFNAQLKGDTIITSAQTLWNEYNGLIEGATSDVKEFVEKRIGNTNSYAEEIFASMAINGNVEYGADTASVTLTAINGNKTEATASKTETKLQYALTKTYNGAEYGLTAEVAEQNVTVRTITVTVDKKSVVYGEDEKALTATTEGLVYGDSEADVYTLSRVAGSTVGNYNVSATVNTEFTAYYIIELVNGENAYEITKKSITISVSDHANIKQSSEYVTDIDAKVVGLVGSDNANLTYNVLDADGNVIATIDATGKLNKQLDVASYVIEAIANNDNYSSYCNKYGNIKVVGDNDYYTVTVTFKNNKGETVDSHIYDGTVVTYEVSVTITQTGDKVNAFTFVSQPTIKNAGTYEVKVQVEEESYSEYFEVSKKELTLEAKDGKLVYNGSYIAPEIIATNLIGQDEVTVSNKSSENKNVGSYKLYADAISGASANNYKLANDAYVIYEIVANEITLEVQKATSVYGDELANLTAVLTGGTLGAGDNLNSLYELAVTAKNVGAYDVSCKGLNNNYSITFTGYEGAYTVTERPITVNVKSLTKVYGDKDETLVVTEVVGGVLANGDSLEDLKYLLTRAQSENVGTYAISGEDKDANYTITFTQATYTITAKDITVSVADGSKTYGDKDGEIKLSVIAGSFAFTDNFASIVKVSREEGENVGTYKITAEVLSNDNYNVKVQYTKTNNSVYTIGKRTAKIVVSDKSTDNTAKWSDIYALIKDGYITENVVSGDSLNVQTFVTINNDTLNSENFFKVFCGGRHVVSATYSNDNYDVTVENGTLTVTLPQISFKDLVLNYVYSGEEVKAFSLKNVVGALESATENTFRAKYYDADGQEVTSVVNAGAYKMVIEIVNKSAYEFKSGVQTEYTVTVEKKDISDNVTINKGDKNYLVYRADIAVSASVEGYDVATVLSYLVDGKAVTELSTLGKYKVTATVDDENYKGETSVEFYLVKNALANVKAITDTVDSANELTGKNYLNKIKEAKTLSDNLSESDKWQIADNEAWTSALEDLDAKYATVSYMEKVYASLASYETAEDSQKLGLLIGIRENLNSVKVESTLEKCSDAVTSYKGLWTAYTQKVNTADTVVQKTYNSMLSAVIGGLLISILSALKMILVK